MPALFALVLVLAAPVSAPATTAANELDRTVAAADTTLRAGKLGPGSYDYDGAIARASGLDPDLLAARLDALTSTCPAPGPCAPLGPHADLLDRLARALGQLGETRHAASLLRAAQRGSFAASQGLDDLRTRAMIEALPRARCEPPTAAELGRTAAGLADFMVVRVRAGVLTAEALQPRERDDLAYFLAAVADAGRELGAPPEPATRKPGAQDQLRSDALARLDLATHAGDLPGALAAGRRYLASFGYPGALASAADPDQAWGGARHSFVMRELAGLAELTGELALAYDLHRRADPGGGMCGTSYWSYYKTQVGGLIRSAERLGDCRPVIAERLLDIDVEDSSDATPDPRGLGTGRLAAAGFDVSRLYRGAMLTLGRDDEPALRRALAAAPASLAAPALARLARRGREDWARRVYAIEGLAATGNVTTLTTLAGMLDTVLPADQARAARTIGEAAQRPAFDPCGPHQSFGFGSSSNVWTREVPMLGRRCETSLTLAQSEALARALLPLVDHRDEQVHNAAVEALGKLAVESARPTLRRLARLRPLPCADDITCAAQRRHHAAVEAVATFTAAPRDPEWRKYDGKRGR